MKQALDEVSERTMTDPIVIPEVGCSPFLIIQRLLSSQMDLAFKMLFHVKDFLLVTFEVLGYFFLKVSARLCQL